MTADIDKAVADAVARFEALSPEEQAAHREEQRRSWVRGEMGMKESAVLAKPAMTADTPARVSDERIDNFMVIVDETLADEPDNIFVGIVHRVRQRDATITAQAERIAALEAEVVGARIALKDALATNEAAESSLAASQAKVEAQMRALVTVRDDLARRAKQDGTVNLGVSAWIALNEAIPDAALSALPEAKPAEREGE